MGVSIGTKVKIHYYLKDDIGNIIGETKKDKPIEFVVGNGDVVKGLEYGVISMVKGEKKTIKIEPKEGHGFIDLNLISEVELSKLPENVKVGDSLTATGENGTKLNVTVASLHDDYAMVHADHPLAGRTLIYDVELVDVE